jgi:hypothetical protein
MCQFVVKGSRQMNLLGANKTTNMYSGQDQPLTLVARSQNICCGLPVTEPYQYCPLHLCGIDGCDRSVTVIGDRILSSVPVQTAQYCHHHLCHYITPNHVRCMTIVRQEAYCPEHKCHARGCSRGIDHRNDQYCSVHLESVPCRYPGCEKTSHKDSGWCEQHKCRQCGLSRQMNVNGFCLRCTCRVPECQNPVVNRKHGYCVEHTDQYCHYLGCCQKACERAQYCPEHRCGVPACTNHIWEYDDQDGGYRSDYCHGHDQVETVCQHYRLSVTQIMNGRGYDSNNYTETQVALLEQLVPKLQQACREALKN